MAELDPADARRLAGHLFVPAERWGWHCVAAGRVVRREGPELRDASLRALQLVALAVFGTLVGGPVGTALWVLAFALAVLWFGPRVVAGSRAGVEDHRAVWHPLDLGTPSRVDVVGGTPDGWAALLCTAGASMLGSGTAVTVVDLTGEDVSGPLCALAAVRGLPVERRDAADGGEGGWPSRGLAVLTGGPEAGPEAGAALLRQVEGGGATGRDVLVLAGAGRLDAGTVEALARACRPAGPRLVLLLEQPAAERLAAGAPVTLVMRLGTGAAAVAADHLGRGRPVVLPARVAGSAPASREVGVTPAVLESLDATSFLLAEAAADRVAGGTCDPHLALLLLPGGEAPRRGLRSR
jgi:hypothetical protein